MSASDPAQSPAENSASDAATPRRRNVTDAYQDWTNEAIAADLQHRSHPVAVAMEQWQGDFNFGTLVRNANAFGAAEVFYVGRRRWDRRGAVGTHHYTSVRHLPDLEALIRAAAAGGYTLVAADNVEGAADLRTFAWPNRPLVIFGEESTGLTDEALAVCSHVIQIPQFGSVRSLNAGTASGVVLYDWVSKHTNPPPRDTLEGSS